MWVKVAKEMGLPWKPIESMYWKLGEKEMARLAGVKVFNAKHEEKDDLYRAFKREESPT